MLPTEIEAKNEILRLVRRLHELCPDMELQQYEPRSYDYAAARLQNLMKNKQRTLAARVESRAIIYLLLSYFLRTAYPKRQAQDERIKEVLNYIQINIGKKIFMKSCWWLRTANVSVKEFQPAYLEKALSETVKSRKINHDKKKILLSKINHFLRPLYTTQANKEGLKKLDEIMKKYASKQQGCPLDLYQRNKKQRN